MDKLKTTNYRPQAGQSILEVIVAMAIFALIGAALATMAVGGFVSLEQGGEQTEAEALAQEGIEAVRSIRDGAWNENVYDQSAVSVSGNQWIFDGEGTTETIGQYTRTITFDDVCRDANDDIATCPATHTDVQTKKVTSLVSWTTRGSITNSVERIAYITNWDSADWAQTNWVGGSGQATWSDATKYNSRDVNNYAYVATAGEVSIVSGDTTDDSFDISGDSSYNWPFSTAGNYTYDSDKITVTGAFGQLKGTGAVVTSGTTLNQSFDTDTSSWIYSDWQQGGGINVTGTRIATGGNPNGYINVSIPGKKNDTSSGYWEQPFTTYRDNPTGDTIDFDYKIIDFNDTPNVAHIRAYVDTASGTPTTQVGSSISFSAEGAWTSAVQIDPSSAITTAGVYYLKIAVWIETPAGGGVNATGPFTIGFDNVNIDLGNGEHPESASLISSDFDTGAVKKIQVIEWDETIPGAAYANKAQIRTATTQAGLDTAEWSGPEGKDGDETDYFTTSTGELIHTDHNGDQWMRYKVLLTGDGDETPILTEIRVNYK